MRAPRQPEIGDGLIRSDESWAWWGLDGLLSTNGWSCLTPEERMGRHYAMALSLSAIHSGEVHLVDYARPQSAADWMDRVKATATEHHPADWLDAALTGCARHLDATVTHRSWSAIGVRVDVDTHSAVVTRRGQRVTEALQKVRRIAPDTDPWPELVRKADGVGANFARLTARRDVPERLTDVDLNWMLSHSVHRGLPEWDSLDVPALFENEVERRGPVLEYKHPAGNRFVMWMMLNQLPDDMAGVEWLTLHRLLPFPVDLSVRMRVVPPSEAAADAVNAGIKASEHVKYLEEMRRSPDPELLEQMVRLPEVAADIRRGFGAVTQPAVRFCVWADDLDTLADRASALRQTYADAGMSITVPASAEQPRFDIEALPASSERHPDFMEIMPALTFARSAFGVDTGIGDPDGPYAGTILDKFAGRPFGMDPLAASKESDSTVVAYLGIMGSGKTFASLIACIWAFLRGASIIDIDPNGDSEGIHIVLPDGSVQVVSYGPESVPGTADPYITCHHRMDPATVAGDTIRLIIPPHEWDAHRTAILRACAAERNEATGATPATMTGVIARLAAHADAACVAESLEAARELPLARALFAHPDDLPAPTHIDGRWTRFSFPGLVIDDQQSESIAYAISMALLNAVSAAVTEQCFATKHGPPKIVRWDEVHRVARSESGQAAIQLMAREGRKFNVAVLAATQVWDDLPSVVRDVIGAMLVFRTPNRNVAEEFCRALDVDPSFSEELMTMPAKSGQAMYRDRAGAVAKVQIDPVFADWAHAISQGGNPGDDVADDNQLGEVAA